jgi:penicillin-binding protein 1A
MMKLPKIFWKAAAGLVLLAIIAGFAAAGGLYWYFSRDLPELKSLKDYKPMINTEIYSDDGTLTGEFAEEYRKVVPFQKIPPQVKNAFLAVEDARFYQHGGMDFHRMVGALYHDVLVMKPKEGASTITMQLARTFYFTRKKLFSRKLREMILAYRIDHYLKKDEILELYLNQIYLGHNAYGVEAAAEKYFGKSIDQVSVGEAAVLASIPKSPAGYDPIDHPDKVKQRQKIVFMRMVEEKMLTEEQAKAAEKQPIVINYQGSRNSSDTAYFVEAVRRYLVNRYGYDKVYKEGLKVFTTMNLDMQKAAANAVREGIGGPNGIDKQRGFRGPVEKMEFSKMASHLQDQESQLLEHWAYENIVSGGDPHAKPPKVAPLELNAKYKATVIEVDKAGKKVKLGVGLSHGYMSEADCKWALAGGRQIDKLFSPGDVVWAVALERNEKDGSTEYRFALEQEPEIESGFLSFSVRSGEIKALVGGYDFYKSQLIRPLQSVRQPGSAFKPILYGAALEQPKKDYTPATIIFDAPVIYQYRDADQEDGSAEKTWTPDNYGGRFSGPRTMRTALEKSINTISVKIMEGVGVSYTINFAHKLGIKSPLEPNYSTALGTNPLSLLELSRAYNVYASGGYLVEPYMVRRVYDRDGNLLEWHHPVAAQSQAKTEIVETDLASGSTVQSNKLKPIQQSINPVNPADVKEPGPDAYLVMLREKKIPSIAGMDFTPQGERVITPQIAYLMTYMLQGVIQRGTGAAASALGRPLAGKTGTTNEFRDAWFIGFSPEIIAGVWVGYDDFNRNLGEGNAGARVALPIWMNYMRSALSVRPVLDFPAPNNIEFARIDQKTGLLANSCTEKSVMEAFIAGTAPNEYSSCGVVPATDDMIKKLDY